MGDILKKVLRFEEDKNSFTVEEQKIIKENLLATCNNKIKQLTKVFIKTIDDING